MLARRSCMLGNTAVSSSSTTQHCVTLSTSEASYVAMAHGAKTTSAIKSLLDFVQPHLSGRVIDMYEDNEEAKTSAENPQGSHRSKHTRALLFSAEACEIGAGNNSQWGLGRTTCGHPFSRLALFKARACLSFSLSLSHTHNQPKRNRNQPHSAQQL